MENAKRASRRRIARFAIVGVVNTATNFAVLNVALYNFHQGKLASSIIATSFAIAGSFVLNRSFVFGDKQYLFKKLTRFILVSSCGVLVIQTSVYALFVVLLQNRLVSELAVVNFSNALASTVVALWNYNGYRLFVFNGKGLSNEITETLDPETAGPA